MSGIALIVCFVIAVVVMIVLISKLGVHPFIAIMLVSLALAVIASIKPVEIEGVVSAGIDLVKVPAIIGEGFSGIFKSIGIVIILGALIGMALEKTGAALKLADMVVRCVGYKRPELAMLIMGWIVGIPVFCDSGFVEFMKANAHLIGTVGIFFPFVISAIIKTAQGSSTVALTTTASIMGLFTDSSSMMSALGLTSEMGAVLTVMAIAAGAMTVSHANDSYFWVVTNFSKMSPEQGYKTQTMLTFIMGIVGMATVWVASLILL